MDILEILLPFAAVIAIAGTVAVVVVRSERRLRAAFAETAARRGWVVEMGGRTAAGRRGRIIRPGPNGPERWEFAQITTSRARKPGGGSGGSSTRSEWTDPGRRAPAGVYAFGPPITAEAGALAANLAGMLDGPMGRALLARLLGPIGAELPQLRYVAAPGRKARGFTLFTTANDPTALDLDAIDAALQGWRSAGRDAPILLAESERLRLLLSRAVADAAEAEALIDLGRALAALFPLNHPER